MSFNFVRIPALAIAFAMMAADALHAQAPAGGPCPATLPVGTWNITANGRQGVLTIPVGGVDAAGNLTGTMTLVGDGVDAIRGFWTAASCRISFFRVDGLNLLLANPTFIQTYEGYAYPTQAANPFGQKRLAGSFGVYHPAAGGASARNTFGWDAWRF